MARTSWVVSVMLGAAMSLPGQGSAVRAGDEDLGPSLARTDARLGAAVRFARAIADERIAKRTECRELFDRHGADGADLLAQADYLLAEPSDAGWLCSRNVAAFTRMRNGRTWLCRDAFLRLTRHQGAVVLLHEALHTAGLGEHPHHPGAPTWRQIDRMVRSSCGL